MLCLTLSGGVSATLQAATAASKAVSDTIAVRALDSRSLTLGLGLMVLDIAERAAAGADLDELEARVAELVPRVHVYGAVDTLEHLEKGGRIGGRARSSAPSCRSSRWSSSWTAWSRRSPNSARGCARSSTWPTRPATPRPLSRIAVANGAASDIDPFLALLSDVKSEHPLLVCDLGPVVGTHTGPGTIGVCMVTVD